MAPAARAMEAAPSWWAAKIHPYTNGEILLTEDVARQLDGGGHGGDPVEAIEDDEQDQPEVGGAEGKGRNSSERPRRP